MGRRGRKVSTGIDLRFVSQVDPDILRHPMVTEAGRCPLCGTGAPPHATAYRQRRVIETIVAAETETFDAPVHGPVWELLLPPFVTCGHMTVLPLPVWSTADGRWYYARARRHWEP